VGPRAVLDSVKENFSSAAGKRTSISRSSVSILIIIDMVSEHLKVVQNIIR